ncbi:unnamed protein product [Allacma fusca]|uniref:Uncharacterized protein n=1 Tax=Allacma fusca TaxID=39272 RepID=A0A8J2L3U1_9HEXA|nr:unnamed protein product [Allacma fusca]
MLTCVYQPPLPLSKNCLLKVNRDSKKVIVSKFSEEKGGKVKVEIASNHRDTSVRVFSLSFVTSLKE